MMNKYSIDYKVVPEDIDELNHVNNIRYLEWVQDISKEHWFRAIEGKIHPKKYIWVIASHHLDYLRPALLNDELEIETFVKDFEGKFSHRTVRVKNKETGKLLFKSLTKWCLVEVSSGSTINVTDDIAAIFI
ncbi:MAG: acyl-CoA thioesterase [Bacteroidetes bacterium]|nr:acyl-CoA thioesterase [Bacteroidota bacterium]